MQKKKYKKSLLNKLNNDVMKIVMSTATNNYPSVIDYDTTFNAIWEKCPGLEFLIQNANQAYMTGTHIVNQDDKELQERCMKLYVQCVVAFNMLVVLHNLEESDKLEKELMGESYINGRDTEIKILNQVIDEMYHFSFGSDNEPEEKIKAKFRKEAMEKLGINSTENICESD